MPVIHYLNVRQGDCTIIKHGSGPVYCTNEKFSSSELGDKTFFDSKYKAWLCGFVT
jgi:hypothetical protein